MSQPQTPLGSPKKHNTLQTTMMGTPSGSKSPSKVHKFAIYSNQVSQDDVNEIMISLQKLNDSDKTMKQLMSTMEGGIREVQLNLENLVGRSSNNNSQLKDLLKQISAPLERKQPEMDFTQLKTEIIESHVTHTERLIAQQTREQELLRKVKELEEQEKSKDAKLEQALARIAELERRNTLNASIEELIEKKTRLECDVSRLEEKVTVSETALEKLSSKQIELDQRIAASILNKYQTMVGNLKISLQDTDLPLQPPQQRIASTSVIPKKKSYGVLREKENMI